MPAGRQHFTWRTSKFEMSESRHLRKHRHKRASTCDAELMACVRIMKQRKCIRQRAKAQCDSRSLPTYRTN